VLLHQDPLLILLLLLHHDHFLRICTPLPLLLIIYKLNELFSGHGKDLIQLSKHKTFEKFIRNTQNWGSVRLVGDTLRALGGVILLRLTWYLLFE
jgi:hypothetical protein